jgi:hypothetical protein
MRLGAVTLAPDLSSCTDGSDHPWFKQHTIAATGMSQICHLTETLSLYICLNQQAQVIPLMCA